MCTLENSSGRVILKKISTPLQPDGGVYSTHLSETYNTLAARKQLKNVKIDNACIKDTHFELILYFLKCYWPTTTIGYIYTMPISYTDIIKTVLPCKDKRQYLLTLQVSRYCLLDLQSRVVVCNPLLGAKYVFTHQDLHSFVSNPKIWQIFTHLKLWIAVKRVKI